jgi:hypothetical protein
MEGLSLKIVRRFLARSQMDDLVDQASRTTRGLWGPRLTVGLLAKNVVRSLVRQDGDGSMLGAVYNDSFDREQFVRSLTLKLRGLDVNAHKIAEAILFELEDQ